MTWFEMSLLHLLSASYRHLLLPLYMTVHIHFTYLSSSSFPHHPGLTYSPLLFQMYLDTQRAY